MTQISEASIRDALKIIEGYEGLGGQKGNLFYPYHGGADPAGVITLGKGRVIAVCEKAGCNHDAENVKCDWNKCELKNGIIIGGVHVYVRKGITIQQVEQLFVQTVEPRVKRLASLIPKATDNEFAAALSFFYNNEAAWGPKGSPGNFHRAGMKKEAALSFFLYRKSGAPLLPRLGLWRRRGTEALYYLTGELIIAKDSAKEKQLFDRLTQLGVKPTPSAKWY